MAVLRQDLVSYRDETDNKRFFVEDPVTSTMYEFDEKEYYLISALSEPHNEAVLVAKYNATFKTRFTLTELRAFIEKLGKQGLLDNATTEQVNTGGQALPLNVIPHRRKADSATQDVVAQSANGGHAYLTGNTSTSPAASPVDFESLTEKKSGQPATSVSDNAGSNQDQRPDYKNHWSLFPPASLLDFFNACLAFLRHFRIFVPLLFVATVVGFFANLDAFEADLKTIKSNISFLGHLLFSMFTINLMTQLYRGMVARHFGCETPSFGLMLIFGVLPRFNLRMEIPDELPRAHKLWVLGSPIYLRFIVFPIGLILWQSTREQGTVLPLIGAGLLLVSMISFLFVANPLMGSAGYRFLSEYYQVHQLRQKAFRALKYRFFKPPEVVGQYVENTPALRAYAIASIVFVVAIVAFISLALAKWLKMNYGGMGVAVFALLAVYVLVFNWRMKKRGGKQTKAQQSRGEVGAANLKPAESTVAPQPKIGAYDLTQQRKATARRQRILVLIAIGAAMFLPYRYESGGQAEVFPQAVQEIYIEQPGVLEIVHVKGGEWKEKGTVIAEMANEKQARDVDVTRQKIRKTQEEIKVLLTTPSKEEIELAEQALKKARLKLKYSRESFDRLKKLYASKDVALATYQDAEEEMAVAEQEVFEKEVNLQAIRNKVNLHEIESLKIEIGILERELQYYEDVFARTQLKMPISGQIITMGLQDLSNKYFEDGDLLAAVEDASQVRVEVLIPEADISEVQVGDVMRLKLQAFPNKTLQATVHEIHPTTTEDTFGTVVKVVSYIDNPDRSLRTGMTGYAKIDGNEMFLGEAFSRAVVRFVQVEAWSWLP